MTVKELIVELLSNCSAEALDKKVHVLYVDSKEGNVEKPVVSGIGQYDDAIVLGAAI